MRNVVLGALYWALFGLCALNVSGMASKPPPEPLKPSANPNLIQVAQGQVGVMESPLGSNRGKQVDAYNLTCGKDFLGAPWCASFARWCFYQIDRKDVPGAWSPSWYTAKRKIQTQDVKVGDQAVVYFSSMGRFAHTIAAIETVKTRGQKVVEVGTIEGNTAPDGGREGIGVFRRIRQADSITFVRWN